MQNFVKNNPICLCKQKFFTNFAAEYEKTTRYTHPRRL